MDTREVESLRKETQPPRRFTEASLLAAMEGAGKEIEDAELRDAMAESGIGTPATRASIIETLIGREFMERDGRALVATEKGVQVIRLLGEHPLTSAKLTGEWEKRLNKIEQGEDSRPAFMKDIKAFITETVAELDKLKGVQIERAKLGPCPVCGREVHENRKGYSCWTKEDPGCGFVIWKKKAGKNLPVAVAKELMAKLKESLERGDEPPIGRTEKQVTGFRGRSGRSFRAKLRIEPRGEEHPGRWKVEFDEEWADRPRAEPSEEQAEASTQTTRRRTPRPDRVADAARRRQRRPIAANAAARAPGHGDRFASDTASQSPVVEAGGGSASHAMATPSAARAAAPRRPRPGSSRPAPRRPAGRPGRTAGSPWRRRSRLGAPAGQDLLRLATLPAARSPRCRGRPAAARPLRRR